MSDDFISRYVEAFHSIEGWFSFDAALMFMAYNQFIAADGIAGDVLEIGVHHGLSAIGMAALRGPGATFVAVDLFETQQDKNVSGSGSGNLQIFLKNMESFYPDTAFLKPVAGASTELKAEDAGGNFSFCNIDGGHSQDETYHDLDLCWRILLPGGLVALDDYFNPLYPGVCEGAVRFMLQNPEALKPIAVGFNKVLFQKMPAKSDLNAKFTAAFPRVPRMITTLWNTPALLLDRCPLRTFVDISASTPQCLVPAGEVVFAADFELASDNLSGPCGAVVTARVTVVNRAAAPLETLYREIGLTYHLRSSEKATLAWDNDRVAFTRPLKAGQRITLDLPIQVPEQPGAYIVEIDLVWEGVMWFQETGNKTALAWLTAV